MTFRSTLLACGLAAWSAAAMADRAIVSSGWVYDTGPYPSVHASTLVETTGGTLLSAWFGGTNEKHPDVAIWLARREAGRWTRGVKVADGVVDPKTRHPTWNPVLFQPKDGPLQLYYKVGPSPQSWWGMVITSTDDGRTWSAPRRLPDGVLGPIKNKPVQLRDGTIVSPSSVEHRRGWRVHVELSDDGGAGWRKIGPLSSRDSLNAIQPAILVHGDGRLQMLSRTKEMVIVSHASSDGGRSWSEGAPTSLHAPNSGFDAVTLADGRHLLVYNWRAGPPPPGAVLPDDEEDGAGPSPAGTRADYGVRHPLNVSTSKDGVRWNLRVTLEEEPRPHGYAYPAVIQARDGLVHVTYTWNREKIKHVVIDPAKL
jgi:predicted neuraminidase